MPTSEPKRDCVVLVDSETEAELRSWPLNVTLTAPKDEPFHPDHFNFPPPVGFAPDTLTVVWDGWRATVEKEGEPPTDGGEYKFHRPVTTLFHALPDGTIGCSFEEGGGLFSFLLDDLEAVEKLRRRNALLRIIPPGGESAGKSPKKSKRLNPGPLPIPTGEETRTLEEAIACAPHRIGYQFTQVTGGPPVARYKNPARKSGYEVLITPPDTVRWGLPELQAMTSRWDLSAVHALKVVTAMLAANAIKHADGITRGEVKPSIAVEVDEILEAMGRRRVDGAAKWNQARCLVRERLLEISYAAVVGQRKKKYFDKTAGAEIDTYQNEALFVVHDQETEWMDGQRSFDGSGVPVRLVIVGGSLWQRMARYDQMRQYIGEVRTLAKLPVGQPSGQWAFSMLCSVLQQAREKKTPRLEMTRKELLLTIPPDETPQQLWDKGKTDKIKPRWQAAAALLAGVGVTLAEAPPLEVSRGWLEPYLNEKVGVTVANDLQGMADLSRLAATAAGHAARETQPKRKPGRPRRNSPPVR